MTGRLLILYIIVGSAALVLGWFNPPYPFLSFGADPILNLGGLVTGLFVVQGPGSLLLYHFLVGFEDEKSKFSVLIAFIGLGFGGALLRLTIPAVIQLLPM